MSVSAWTETIPSGTSQVGDFPSYARTAFANIATGLAVEHYWPGSGGGSTDSAGELLPGASRAFVDVQSNSSAPNSQMTGRLFLASDVSRLFIYDSSGTYLVGTPYCSEHSMTYLPGSFPYPSPTGYWLRQSGSYTTNTQSGSTSITLPIPYLNPPAVFFTRLDSGTTAVIIAGDYPSVTTNQINSGWSALGATVGSFTIGWEALGFASTASF